MKSLFSGGWVKPAVFLSVFVIFVVGGFTTWTKVLSPEARENRENREKLVEFMNLVNEAEERQRNDQYGGKTPEETLQLFVVALEKGDLELASKYFSLNETGEEDPRWIELLKQIREANNLTKLAGDLKIAVKTDYSDVIGSCMLSTYRNGEIIGNILLIKNKFSNLWKIEEI